MLSLLFKGILMQQSHFEGSDSWIFCYNFIKVSSFCLIYIKVILVVIDGYKGRYYVGCYIFVFKICFNVRCISVFAPNINIDTQFLIKFNNLHDVEVIHYKLIHIQYIWCICDSIYSHVFGC